MRCGRCLLVFHKYERRRKDRMSPHPNGPWRVAEGVFCATIRSQSSSERHVSVAKFPPSPKQTALCVSMTAAPLKVGFISNAARLDLAEILQPAASPTNRKPKQAPHKPDPAWVPIRLWWNGLYLVVTLAAPLTNFSRVASDLLRL